MDEGISRGKRFGGIVNFPDSVRRSGGCREVVGFIRSMGDAPLKSERRKLE